MPSPIAHIAAGYGLSMLYRRDRGSPNLPGGRLSFAAVAVMLALSLLPDLDAVPGLLLHDMGRYHNNISHSLAATLLFASLAGVIAGLLRRGGLKWFLVALSCLGLHLLMDLLTWGRGVMLFWPFSGERILPPVKLFYGFHWSEGLFSARHGWTVLTEGALILAVIAVRFAVIAYSRRKKGATI